MKNDLIFAIVVIPMLILVSLAVVTQFSVETVDTFEGSAITGESIGNNTSATLGGTFYADYPALSSAGVTLYNCSLGTESLCAAANYNVSYDQGFSLAKIVIGACVGDTIQDTNFKLNYTPLNLDGYNEFISVTEGTNDGFDLAAMLPFIMMAVAIIGLIFVGFGLKGF